MPSHVPDTFRWCDPIGKCIYCGSTEPPLTKEHILPQGLGARWFLPAASCEACRRITHKFETEVQRGMIWPIRAKSGLRGQKRKAARVIPTVLLGIDGVERKVDLAPSDFPVTAVLPSFLSPAMLTGMTLPPGQETFDLELTLYGDGAAAQRAYKAGFHGQPQEVHVRSFARMIAKISHCMAVARVGVDGFEPLLCDIIRGNATNWAQYVGCGQPARPPRETNLHLARMRKYSLNGQTLLMGYIRLFADIGDAKEGTPEYMVVTGRLPADQ